MYFGKYAPAGLSETSVCRLGNTEWNTPRGVTGKRSWYSDWMRGWTVRGSNPGGGNRFLSSRKRPYRLRGPPTIIFCGYRGSSPGLRRLRREVTHLLLVSRLRISGAVLLLHMYAFMSWTGNIFTPEKRLVVLCFVTAFFILNLSCERFSYDLQNWKLCLIYIRLVQTTAEDAGGLTSQYRSRCNARPFNSSHAAGLGAPYGGESI